MFAKAHMIRLEQTLAGRKLKEEVRKLLCSAMGFRGCTQEAPNLQPQET